MGSGMRFPARKVQVILALAEAMHDKSYLWMSEHVFGHQYLVLSMLWVFWVPRCQEAAQYVPTL